MKRNTKLQIAIYNIAHMYNIYIKYEDSTSITITTFLSKLSAQPIINKIQGKGNHLYMIYRLMSSLNQCLGFARKSYGVHLNNYELVTVQFYALHCPEESNQTLRVRKHKKGLLCCRIKVSLRTCLRLVPIIDNLQKSLILFTRYESDFAAKESGVLKSQSQVLVSQVQQLEQINSKKQLTSDTY
ncbi:unnamed protein product (macronuclear) [Paramecium tetraurelia]|uniref:Uncharacterized protein n=1 Tax=Paramecium tetraurelia TaxID=5888 RepID=A0C1U6_PARTE|nr:uncharacterized protein GSPATT00034240001 [Paramecium tetraurelia]CAK64763.1 unnamed protein product [Paramecium tetraurelia]|eukprot:XP_001432160.1 hypothetical protein (macronuclear) [Paramecium tetraurelia strain d4-2]